MAPVYLFTGFLDSGKTTLIKDTLNDPGFMEGTDRTLILCFEQGENSYDEKFLDEHNAFIEFFDASTELTPEKMHELDTIYHPDQVFIEYNGTEVVSETLLKEMPPFWPLVQILTTVDATTFELYINAMRSMLFEQLRWSDTIIVNRCTPDMSGSMLRGNIKAINRRAQIYYEGAFGEPVELKNGLLPFDINADVIDISDDDYGLWYMDAAENPDKYDGKTIIIRGMYAENIPGYKQTFVLGRRAMVCCAQDTSLCGITVTNVKIWEMQIGDWVEVEGKLKTIPVEGGGKTVVLYADRIARYEKPADEYVTFS
ncbi:MAG: GTP-binding protein [Erysipelotrichaceae bacterium]|nr:GTP-binding protein [Erysipelotrichaceae bacterium]